MNRDYLKYALLSDFVFDQACAIATGIAQKTVPLAGLRKLNIPLPPVAEQRRIVAKVDELMALVNTLEAQLATARTTAEKLTEALVTELTAAERTRQAQPQLYVDHDAMSNAERLRQTEFSFLSPNLAK